MMPVTNGSNTISNNNDNNNRVHRDHRILKIGLNTGKSPWVQRRIATQTLVNSDRKN